MGTVILFPFIGFLYTLNLNKVFFTEKTAQLQLRRTKALSKAWLNAKKVGQILHGGCPCCTRRSALMSPRLGVTEAEEISG